MVLPKFVWDDGGENSQGVDEQNAKTAREQCQKAQTKQEKASQKQMDDADAGASCRSRKARAISSPKLRKKFRRNHPLVVALLKKV